MKGERGRPPGHHPANAGRASARKPVRTALPVLRTFFTLLDADARSVETIARRAGAHKVTITMWRGGHRAPSLMVFQNMLEAMGYGLAIVPLSGMTADNNEQTGQTEPPASD